MPIELPDADRDSATGAVAAALARIGAAWTQRRYADLADCFATDMIIVAPDGSRVAGREACVASYRAFLDHTTITDYREVPPQIDLLGDTAGCEARRQGTDHHERSELRACLRSEVGR